MDETDNPHLRDILDEAADVPPERRDDFLNGACEGDLALRDEVELLLASLDEASDFLTAPTHDRPLLAVGLEEESDYTVPPLLRERPGTCIGPYKLLEQIGEGGMGVVFMAEQERPVRRRVALKIIKPGMDSAQVIARLESERQALAMMEHPNIARVFDAGATESGLPYFVMELVQGVPITRYCDDMYLSPQERLELFIPVCQALQHAHQKGIIHRDLKPSNVLVMTCDGKPVPKIIDFGVAKPLHQKLTEKTLCTQLGHAVGTLEYMSPEQAEMDVGGMDTRSDIYSLGVLLYELLTGSTPLDRKRLRDAGYAQMLKTIREEEPPKPSTKVGSSIRDAGTRRRGDAEIEAVSEHRSMEPRRLVRLLSGDLDWIIMKCLEKDRARRYETANGLARDIRRFLDYEPVEACPPSTGYKLRKFARKHRIPISVAAAFIVLLLCATVVSAWQAIRATRAGNREATQRTQAEAVARVLESIFHGLDPERSGYDPRTAMLGQLDMAIAALNPPDYSGDPLVRARLRHALGGTELDLGEIDRAVTLLKAALEEQLLYLGTEDPETLSTMNDLAMAYNAAGRTVEATALFEKVRGRRVETRGLTDADTLDTIGNLGVAYTHAGKYRQAIALLEEVRRKQTQKLGPDHWDTLKTMNNLAVAYLGAGRYQDAIKLFEEERDRFLKIRGPDHIDTLTTQANLGTAYDRMGRTGEAIILLEQMKEQETRLFGPDHPETLNTLCNLAHAYDAAGQYPEAIALYEQAKSGRVRKLGAYHPHTMQTVDDLAMAMNHAGRTAEAINLLERLRDDEIDRMGADHPDTLTTINNLGSAYMSAHRYPEAIKALQQARDGALQVLGPDHPDTLTILNNLAMANQNSGNTADAIALYQRVADQETKSVSPDHPYTLRTLGNLAGAYAADGRIPEAVELYEQVRAREIKKLGLSHPDVLLTTYNLADLYQRKGYPEKAEPLWLELSNWTLANPHGVPARKITAKEILPKLIACYRALGKTDKADEWSAELRALTPQTNADGQW